MPALPLLGQLLLALGLTAAGARFMYRRPRAPRFSPRHAFVPRVSRSRDREGAGIRVRVIAAHRDARRRPPPPVGRSPPSRPGASSPCAGIGAGRRERQSRAVAHGALPRGGVRDGVLPLRVLLPGAGVLWGGLPRTRATAPAAARERAASAHPGRPARPPGPPTGLPRAVSPPARDGSTFHSPPSIPHHRPTPADAPEPARVPRVWARVALGDAAPGAGNQRHREGRPSKGGR